MHTTPSPAGPAPATLTVTAAEAAAAFALWESAYRADPERFLTADEVAPSSVADCGHASAVYFMAMLKKVQEARPAPAYAAAPAIDRRVQDRRQDLQAMGATAEQFRLRAKLAEQQRDDLREALFNYLQTIAEAGGGDKQQFMAAIREADNAARSALARTGGAA